MTDSEVTDPFAHLKLRASQRADRTVERIQAGVAALQATGRKITAESIKQVTRDLEPGFAGLTFQVIRRNARAYALYREAADAFKVQTTAEKQPSASRRRRRQRIRGTGGRTRRSSYDPLQRLEKKELVQRIRSLEMELEIERQRRGALAYDEQVVLAKMLRLETEIILLQVEGRHTN
jgi:hypothetical protein